MSAVTEAEATGKWCPQAQVAVTASDDIIANTLSGRFVTCAASGCMAWRWHEPWTSSTEEGQGGDLVLRLARKPGEPKRGYCGLAGAP